MNVAYLRWKGVNKAKLTDWLRGGKYGESDVIQVHGMIETRDHEISIDPDPRNTFFFKKLYIGVYFYKVSLLLLSGRNC